MANTYVKIAEVSVTSAGGQAAIDFTSIPSTYTDLVLKICARSTGADDYGQVTFNGSSANFTRRFILGLGSSIQNSSFSNNSFLTVNPSGYTANTFANVEYYIPNYAGSTNKSVSLDGVTENNATSASTMLQAILWSNTAAITSISMTCNTGNFAQYSTAYLYGISKS